LEANIPLPTIVTDFPQDPSGLQYVRVKPLRSGETVNLTWKWKLPSSTGNDVQGKGVSFSLNYLLEEASVTQVPGSTVNISVVLQGGVRPTAGYVIPITVKFFSTLGGNVLTATSNYTSTQNTTRVGVTTTVIANVTAIPPDTYDITVKSDHTLLSVKRNVVISEPSTNVTMGTLFEGNANESNPPNTNIINISDFTTLSATYAKSLGAPGYNAQADFDRNNIVNISDFTLLSGNYQKSSPITVP
jgi:hypothetical protein